jgi:hypothetical protein
MKKIITIISLVTCFNGVTQLEQNGLMFESKKVKNTFNSTRIINGHSSETLEKGELEFRIEHRFGDVAGVNGGAQNFFGFDNATDIRFAFEYGLTKKIMLGLGRSKGNGNPYRSLLDGFIKFKLLEQDEPLSNKKIPISVSILGTSSLTYMKASNDISQITHYPKFAHRMAYSYQINIARKFGERLSIAIMPSYVYRNYVAANDLNGLFAMGSALKIGITNKVALITEYYHTFHDPNLRQNVKNSLSFGLEIKTFGHNFHLNLTNASGFGETQFIPYTTEDWLKGQFRLGFSISRTF